MTGKNDVDETTKISFFDPGFEELAKAISLQNSRREVAIVFHKPLFRDDYFQLTKTWPTSISNFQSAFSLFEKWKKLFSIAPQLVVPQKVIYFNQNQKWLSKITDFRFKNKDQRKSDHIMINLPKNLSFLNMEKLQGVVFQEYKVNVSRLYIELLKVFENVGGKVIFEANSDAADDDQEDNGIHEKSFETSIACPENFCLFVNKDKTEIVFSEQNEKLTAVLTGLNPEPEIIFEFLTDKNGVLKEFDLPHLLSDQSVTAISEYIKEQLLCTFKGTGLESNYELCLEKFDIAKQTGIDFPAFRKLFYRYGFHIERLTDMVYDNMVSERDPVILWRNAEYEFQKTFEWGS